MNTIWKFTLRNTDYQNIEMPVGARILCVREQNSAPQIWAICNPDAEKETRHFRIYGTGQALGNPHAEAYIGTYQVSSGKLVFHLFEI